MVCYFTGLHLTPFKHLLMLNGPAVQVTKSPQVGSTSSLTPISSLGLLANNELSLAPALNLNTHTLAITVVELIWLQFMLRDLGVFLSTPPTLWRDNIGATYLTANPAFHARTIHIEINSTLTVTRSPPKL